MFDTVISFLRSQRGLSRCQRWPWGSFIQPFGLAETATPAGRKGFTKLSVSSIALYQMPSDFLVVPLADEGPSLMWCAHAQMHAQAQTYWKKGVYLEASLNCIISDCDEIHSAPQFGYSQFIHFIRFCLTHCTGEDTYMHKWSDTQGQ